jgi:hypothetical protein
MGLAWSSPHTCDACLQATCCCCSSSSSCRQPAAAAPLPLLLLRSPRGLPLQPHVSPTWPATCPVYPSPTCRVLLAESFLPSLLLNPRAARAALSHALPPCHCHSNCRIAPLSSCFDVASAKIMLPHQQRRESGLRCSGLKRVLNIPLLLPLLLSQERDLALAHSPKCLARQSIKVIRADIFKAIDPALQACCPARVHTGPSLGQCLMAKSHQVLGLCMPQEAHSRPITCTCLEP